jgi:oxidase EvaA
MQPATAEPCRPIQRLDSREWIYSDERIAHHSGRFFSVVGVETSDPFWAPQPLIDQPEIGTLGFAFRRTQAGLEALIQRKHEPGNVGGTQIGPTCQATRSNLDRVHGGSLPPGAELFSAEALARAVTLSDSLQSEQGSRFLGKRNRNLTAFVPDSLDAWPEAATALEWVSLRALLARLASSFEVNTDARSVLVTTPWDVLAEARPPGYGETEFGRLVRGSRAAGSWRDTADGRDRTWARLLAARRDVPEVRPCALDRLPHHRLDAFGLVRLPGSVGFDVRHFAVSIPGREREEWDQPLITSDAPGLVELDCFVREGTLRLAFRIAWEPGLHDGLELHPTLVLEPGGHSQEAAVRSSHGRPIVETWQSDEGGRFYRSLSIYRLVMVNDPGPEGPAEVHLTLGEAESLLNLGAFTNESRSALALLLPSL